MSDNLPKQSIVQRFRPGCYAILRSEDQVILVEKMRGPFLGLYDLPGGGVDHGEDHTITIIRELKEEIGLDISPEELGKPEIFTHIVEYTKDDIITSLHMIGMVYQIELEKTIFADVASGKILGTEIGGDAGARVILKLSDIDSMGLTPICRMALEQYITSK